MRRDFVTDLMRCRSAAVPCFALAVWAVSCTSLEKEPWAKTEAGSHGLSLLTGTTAYEAEVRAQGVDGPIAGLSDSTETTLDPKFGVQLEYTYFVLDDFGIGAGGGVRRFDPTSTELFGAGFDADEFQTTHLFLTTRYFLPALGDAKRWRPLVGIDLGYVPEVDLDSTVDYGGGFTQPVHYDGDAYWSLGFRAAFACLLSDALSFEIGSFYEVPLDSSDATFTLDIPGAGSSDVAGEILPSGFVFYVGLAYGF